MNEWTDGWWIRVILDNVVLGNQAELLYSKLTSKIAKLKEILPIPNNSFHPTIKFVYR